MQGDDRVSMTCGISGQTAQSGLLTDLDQCLDDEWDLDTGDASATYQQDIGLARSSMFRGYECHVGIEVTTMGQERS